MRLVQLFEQRDIGKTHGSVASSLPLTKPSGRQWTESELETKFVEQLDFSSRVHDIVTQPGIHYRDGDDERRYTPDVFVEILPDQAGSWSYYLVEVKRAEELPRWRAKNRRKILAAHDWCERHHASFRIVTEKEIETPYLRNARRLRPMVDHLPDAEILDALTAVIGPGRVKTSDLITKLVEGGLPEPDVRDALDASVANRLVACDLSRLYDDDAIVEKPDPYGREHNDRDPIIRLLMLADSE